MKTLATLLVLLIPSWAIAQAADEKAAELAKPLRTVYVTDTLAAQERYRAVLEAELDRATRAGNLDAVQAIKAEAETCAADEGQAKSPAHLLAIKRFTAERDAAVRKYEAGLDALAAGAVRRKEIETAERLRQIRDELRLDVSRAVREDGFYRLPPRATISTREAFAGPIEVRAIARTDGTNLRLHAYQSARVILNWESKLDELRVHRPENVDPERASVATAKVTPLRPGVWYALTWRIDGDGMTVSVDGKRVFEERGKYDLSASRPVMISGGMPPGPASIVDVKALSVSRLAR